MMGILNYNRDNLAPTLLGVYDIINIKKETGDLFKSGDPTQ